MVETVIYALVDPRTQAVRYVGKTQKRCAVRFGEHMRRAAAGAAGHRYNCAAGAPLTNATLGGEGAPGRVPSAETRSRIGLCHRGKIETLETRLRKSVARQGMRFSQAHRSAMRASALRRAAARDEELREARAAGASIAELLAAGFSYRAIGRATGVCHHTVKSWVS